ncbi:MAG: alkaline shock response membrane anchor protein AmaP [Candidatus Omnitrophota bacterium]
MNILNRISILFFLIVFVSIGVFLIAVSFRLIQSEPILNALDYIYVSMNLRIALAVIGLLLILVSFASYQFTISRIQRQKNIAFNNPDGQVTISLSAIEEFIRRIGSSLLEVKEMKSDCIATKKGIDITTKVVFWSDANIPEITEKIQSMIKTRVQEMLGVDEPIIIKVHVTKIVARQEDKPRNKERQPDDVSMPFGGME